MFESIFKTELYSNFSGNSLTSQLWTEIQSHYDKTTRYYHNIYHLNNLIEQLLPIKHKIEDLQTLIFSVAYHDIIYNPLRKDNEEKSAAFAHDRLMQLNISSLKIEKCRSQILATKHHQISSENDTNYFTDADLSILGSDHESYQKYTEQIRKEYRLYPDIVYKPGLRKVLEAFIKMSYIFKTIYFRDKYEEQAKSNLSKELNSLRSSQ